MTTPWAVAFLALWVVVLLLAVFVLGLLRRIGPVLERAERAIHMADALDDLDGLAVGSAVPDFEVVDDAGRPVAFADAGPADKVVLFVDAGCPACSKLSAAMVARPEIAELPLVVVTGQGTPVDHYAELSAAGLPVFTQPDGAASAALRIRALPYATAVAGGTVVASRIPGRPRDLDELAGALTGDRHGENSGVPDGAPLHTHP